MTPKLLQAAPADTVSHDLGAEIAAVADKIANTPTSELFAELLDKAVSFGIKVLVAVALYFIGGWLIRRIKKMLQKIFEKHDFLDQAIESFIMSIAGIALWIILIIAIIGTLGIETTSFAALLAGGGMAIGLALNGTVQNFAGGIMMGTQTEIVNVVAQQTISSVFSNHKSASVPFSSSRDHIQSIMIY